MTPEHIAHLEQQLHAAQHENQQLRQQLAAVAEHSQAQAEQQAARTQRRSQVLWGGARLLVPLLDRHKVARSFGTLTQTASRFAGPGEQWPSRDELLGDARVFAESCVRFMIRRRTLLMLLSLFAALIPAIQIWLVVQQNQIIENQNEFFRIQVFDIVSRSMTEGDRNAKLMTGALLSRSDPEFLGQVIDEAFDPDLRGNYEARGVQAAKLRLEDAAFRGHLVRAAVRSIEHRAQADDEPLSIVAEQAQPMLHAIVQDAAGGRVSEVLRLGEGDSKSLEGPAGLALAEDVDGYLVQVGRALRIYGRLARERGDTTDFHDDLRAYLHRVATARLSGSRFGQTQVFVLEELLAELAAASEVNDPPPDLEPEQARSQGLTAAREALGEDGVDWDGLAEQVGAR